MDNPFKVLPDAKATVEYVPIDLPPAVNSSKNKARPKRKPRPKKGQRRG